MEKFKHLQKIKEIYEKGENIIQYLKNISDTKTAGIEDILISYDFQSGAYVKAYSKKFDFKNNYGAALAKIIDKLCKAESIVEVGVGEAIILNAVLKSLKTKPAEILGFDISWSRLKFAKQLLYDFKFNNVKLFTANLFNIPVPSNSVDIVYTSHSIEPNGSKEEEALKELYRITKKYLILLEPSFEFANQQAKDRMKKHGYVTELYATAKKLNYKIIEHRLFDYISIPENPTGLMIIEKNTKQENQPDLLCPVTHTPLQKQENVLYSKESFLSYPVISGIPCLLKENAILTSHLLTDYEKFKTENNIKF